MHARIGDPIEESLPESQSKSRPMPLHALEKFCERMGVGLRTGVDLLRILEVEKKQGNASHREKTEALTLAIRNGSTLAKAMESTKGYYPRMLVQMVSAGEMGGGLDRVFTHMGEYYRDLRNARNDFYQRVSWPLIQLGLAFLIISLVIVLRGFLSPPSGNPNDLEFDASGLGLSGFGGLAVFWSVIGLVLGTTCLVGYGVWKNWMNAHQLLSPVAQKVPLIGTVLTTTAMSRLSMTLAMLLNAGVDAKRCLREAFRSTGNHYFMGGLPKAESVLGKGNSFAEAFEASEVLPLDFVRAIEVGEMSGTETDSLERLANDYQIRAKTALAQLAATASFAIWILISGFIIFVIIRMFMSYVNILNNAGKI